MDVKFYKDIKEFYGLVSPFLLRKEAENNLLFSILNRINQNPTRYGDDKPILIIVTDNSEIKLVSLRTPPYHLILSFTDDINAVYVLAKVLLQKNMELPGVLGFKEGAEKFVKVWCEGKNLRPHLTRNERIYKLEEVAEETLGNRELILGSQVHQSLILDWAEQFLLEAIPETGEEQFKRSQENLIEDIKKDQIYLLLDKNEIVSIVRNAGSTPNGNRVSLVYTPPELRRKGYATECVAKFSKQLLEEGNKFCFLFTDLSNPISNSIYQKIGYQPVIDVDEYKFLPN